MYTLPLVPETARLVTVWFPVAEPLVDRPSPGTVPVSFTVQVTRGQL